MCLRIISLGRWKDATDVERLIDGGLDTYNTMKFLQCVCHIMHICIYDILYYDITYLQLLRH